MHFSNIQIFFVLFYGLFSENGQFMLFIINTIDHMPATSNVIKMYFFIIKDIRNIKRLNESFQLKKIRVDFFKRL